MVSVESDKKSEIIQAVRLGKMHMNKGAPYYPDELNKNQLQICLTGPYFSAFLSNNSLLALQKR